MSSDPRKVKFLLISIALISGTLGTLIVGNFSPGTTFVPEITNFFGVEITADVLVTTLVVVFITSIFFWIFLSFPIVRKASRAFLEVVPFGVFGIGDFISTSNEQLRGEATENLTAIRKRLEKEKSQEVGLALQELERIALSQLEQTVEKSLLGDSGKVELRATGVLARGRDRLVRETERLQARSRANLIYGIFISIIAVLTLVALIFLFPPVALEKFEISYFLSTYLPRLAVSILIQLLGTFFLRLYVSGENDIKQNKNEITNIEMRLASLLAVEGDRKSVASWSTLMTRDERNFILKKGEKVSGEAWKTEAEDLRGVLSQLVDKISVSGASK